MKLNKVLSIFIFSLFLFLISFAFGYQLTGGRLEQVGRNEKNNEPMKKNDYNVEISFEDDRISPNTLVEERVYYNPCQHIDIVQSSFKNQLVNMSKDELGLFLGEYPEYNLIAFSSDKTILGTIKNYLCERHYIIGESEGNLAIYRINEYGQKVLDTIFYDYPISLLMEIDQNRLMEGIIVNSEEELSDTLENFIS